MLEVPRFLQLCYIEVGTRTLDRGVNEPLGSSVIVRALAVTYSLFLIISQVSLRTKSNSI